MCKQTIISFFDANTKFPVYCTECWYSDKWDPRDYGQEFDFNRPFFEQYAELLDRVPKTGMIIYQSENSEYNTFIAFAKNCYMSPGTYTAEDCIYTRKSQSCSDCVDSEFVDHCTLVYESLNCKNCFNCTYIFNSKNCRDSSFLEDCIGCNDCFMSVGLRQKKYHIFNKPYSKEEYLEKVKELKIKSNEELLRGFLEFNKSLPKRDQSQVQCEGCTGDHIENSKNSKNIFYGRGLQDCTYCVECVDNVDCMDISMFDKDNQLCYEIMSGGDQCVETKFSFCPVNTNYSSYLYICFRVQNCFGCDSFPNRAEYCILNKQYSKEEYEELLPRIIEHMKSTGEYGEYMPIQLSRYPYNETVAQDYFPITKEQALSKGYKWRDKDPKQYQPQSYNIPVEIKDVPESITNEILACQDCGKNYRIITTELKFYKKMSIPVPTKCPDCRHMKRTKTKNPKKLFDRNCDQCSQPIQTTYSPDRPETVYCDSCYLKEIY